jgi:hypothetical protein
MKNQETMKEIGWRLKIKNGSIVSGCCHAKDSDVELAGPFLAD